jgi:hypothetical protein
MSWVINGGASFLSKERREEKQAKGGVAHTYIVYS